MEIVKVENNQIILNDEVNKMIVDLYASKVQFDYQMDLVKNALQNAMEQNGIKKFENDVFSATYKEATTRKSVDTNALKEQGLYDMFVKETPVKASVMVKLK